MPEDVGDEGDYLILKVEDATGRVKANGRLSPWLLMIPGIFILLDSFIFLIFYYWSGKYSDEEKNSDPCADREAENEKDPGESDFEVEENPRFEEDDENT